jgi:hypothetical protein
MEIHDKMVFRCLLHFIYVGRSWKYAWFDYRIRFALDSYFSLYAVLRVNCVLVFCMTHCYVLQSLMIRLSWKDNWKASLSRDGHLSVAGMKIGSQLKKLISKMDPL